jgi:hypothetical protein
MFTGFCEMVLPWDGHIFALKFFDPLNIVLKLILSFEVRVRIRNFFALSKDNIYTRRISEAGVIDISLRKPKLFRDRTRER